MSLCYTAPHVYTNKANYTLIIKQKHITLKKQQLLYIIRQSVPILGVINLLKLKKKTCQTP